MNGPALLERLARSDAAKDTDLQGVVGGALNYVWEGRFGSMLIEVKAGLPYVNGEVVERVVAGKPQPVSEPREAKSAGYTPV